MVMTVPKRVPPYTFCVPVFRADPYAPCEVSAAFRIVGALGPKGVSQGSGRLTARKACEAPVARGLRDIDGLRAALESLCRKSCEHP